MMLTDLDVIAGDFELLDTSGGGMTLEQTVEQLRRNKRPVDEPVTDAWREFLDRIPLMPAGPQRCRECGAKPELFGHNPTCSQRREGAG